MKKRSESTFASGRFPNPKPIPMQPISNYPDPKPVFAIEPIPMILTCPSCGARHIDVGEFATRSHHTHACQNCGLCWRPAVVPTVGVQFLPGFKNKE